jgi:hypothetical protein
MQRLHLPRCQCWPGGDATVETHCAPASGGTSDVDGDHGVGRIEALDADPAQIRRPQPTAQRFSQRASRPSPAPRGRRGLSRPRSVGRLIRTCCAQPGGGSAQASSSPRPSSRRGVPRAARCVAPRSSTSTTATGSRSSHRRPVTRITPPGTTISAPIPMSRSAASPCARRS